MGAPCPECGATTLVECRGSLETITCPVCGIVFEGTASYLDLRRATAPAVFVLEVRRQASLAVNVAFAWLRALPAEHAIALDGAVLYTALEAEHWIRIGGRVLAGSPLVEAAREQGFVTRLMP